MQPLLNSSQIKEYERGTLCLAVRVRGGVGIGCAELMIKDSLLQNEFSYNRMWYLTIECVLLEFVPMPAHKRDSGREREDREEKRKGPGESACVCVCLCLSGSIKFCFQRTYQSRSSLYFKPCSARSIRTATSSTQPSSSPPVQCVSFE